MFRGWEKLRGKCAAINKSSCQKKDDEKCDDRPYREREKRRNEAPKAGPKHVSKAVAEILHNRTKNWTEEPKESATDRRRKGTDDVSIQHQLGNH